MKCPKCKKELDNWSKFKDLKMKENIGLAICSSIINGLDHFLLGEWRSQSKKAQVRSPRLHYCKGCKSYYLECLKCHTLIPLSEMPNETRTVVKCTGCKKTVLYADTDYSSGGG